MSFNAPAPVPAPAAQVVETEPPAPVAPGAPVSPAQPHVTNHYNVNVYAPVFVSGNAAAHSATPAPPAGVARPAPHVRGSGTSPAREVGLAAAVAGPPAVAAVFLPTAVVALVVLGVAVVACAVGTVAIRRSGKRAAHAITRRHSPTPPLTHSSKEVRP